MRRGSFTLQSSDTFHAWIALKLTVTLLEISYKNPKMYSALWLGFCFLHEDARVCSLHFSDQISSSTPFVVSFYYASSVHRKNRIILYNWMNWIKPYCKVYHTNSRANTLYYIITVHCVTSSDHIIIIINSTAPGYNSQWFFLLARYFPTCFPTVPSFRQAKQKEWKTKAHISIRQALDWSRLGH